MSAPTPGPLLLVVEDDRPSALMLQGAFGSDYRTELCVDGEEALARCARGAPDLILLDITLPGIDGLEVCRRLKADPATAEVPIIFVSGRQSAGEIAEGLEAGAVDFIVKPIDGNVVRARVRTHLALREAARRHHDAERTRLILDTAPTAMLMVDQGGVITMANAQAAALFGYARNELVGRSVERLVPPDQVRRHEALRIDAFASPVHRAHGGRDLQARRKDGELIPVDIALSSFEVPGGRWVLASIVDISGHKRQAETLRALNQELQERITESERTTRNLRLMQGRLVQAEKLASLGNLVAGIAHEVNTPIGVGVTAASHLDDEVRALKAAAAANTLTRPQFQRFLEDLEGASGMILSNLRRAADLIGSFKRVAVDQTSQERRRIHLLSYLGELVRSLAPVLRPTLHKVQIECPADLEQETVPGALSQIVTNLVLNAVTHAFDPAHPGHMRIEVRRIEGGVNLLFADDGRGIAAEDLPRIFDPFFTTQRGHGGTGLGLNIVFNLVHQVLGGSVEVDSTPGKGTRFTLTLPDAFVPPEDGAATTAP